MRNCYATHKESIKLGRRILLPLLFSLCRRGWIADEEDGARVCCPSSITPLGKTHEFDEPDFATSPETAPTPKDAHIRLANPRTPHALATRILRRGFNYSNGLTKSGHLDMGLLFICYQADLDNGFIAVQQRLTGEPLEEYIKPFGGGYFFALPGVSSKTDFLGQELLRVTL